VAELLQEFYLWKSFFIWSKININIQHRFRLSESLQVIIYRLRSKKALKTQIKTVC